MISSFAISTLVVFLISWIFILFYVFDTFKRMNQVKKFFKIADKKYINKNIVIFIFIYNIFLNFILPIASLILILLYLKNHNEIIGYTGIGICIFTLIGFIIFMFLITKLRMISIIANAKDNLIFTDLIISFDNLIKITFDISMYWIYIYYKDSEIQSLYKLKYSYELKEFLNAKQEH